MHCLELPGGPLTADEWRRRWRKIRNATLRNAPGMKGVYALPRSNAEINFDLSPIESITKRFRKDQFSRVDETIAAVRELRAAIEGWLKKSS